MLNWPDATLYEGIADVAADDPSATAVVFEEETYSYDELLAESRAFANGLSSLGIEAGDTIAVWLGNRPEWIIAQLGASYLGAIVVAANTRYRTHELEYMLSDADCRVLLTESSFLDRDYLETVAEIAPEIRNCTSDSFDPDSPESLEEVVTLEHHEAYPGARAYGELLEAESGRIAASDPPASDPPATDPEAPACLFYTSGTTSDPKGCPQTNRSLLNHSHAVGKHFGLGDGDVGLGVLPFPGVWGHNVFVSALAHGIPLVVQTHFDSEETGRLIERHDVTYFSGLATMYRRLIDHETFDPGRVESLSKGAVGFLSIGFDEETFEEIESAVGFPLVQPYGLSEANSQVFVAAPDDPLELRKRVGGPLVDPETQSAKIVDPETGESLPPGERGELCLRGYNVIGGYLGRPEATKAAFEDGWLHTGDLARRDDEGRFYFESRIDDALRVRGFLVSPPEIEAVIDGMDGVERSQVVGADHPRHGQVPVAFLKAEDSLDADDVRGYLEARVADYKVPAAVRFVESFPRSEGPHGEKIRKSALRERVADGF